MNSLPLLYSFILLLAILCLSAFLVIKKLNHKISRLKGLEKDNNPLSQENIYKSIVENIPDFIYVKDRKSRFAYASKKLLDTVGLKNNIDIIGRTDHDFYPKDLADEFLALENNILQTGIPVIDQIEEGFDERNHPIWVSTTKIPLKDINQNIVGIVGIGRDVSKRVKFQEELKERTVELNEANSLLEEHQEEIYQQQEKLQSQNEIVELERGYLRNLIDNMPDRIYIKDRESRFIIANKHLAQLNGIENPDFMIGKTDFDFFSPELAGAYFKDEQDIIANPKPLINKEERNFNMDGERVIISTTKVPFIDENGEVAGIVGIGRDITQQKNVEKELNAQTAVLREVNSLLEEKQEEITQQSEELMAQTEHLLRVNNELEKLSLVASRTDNVIVIMDAQGNLEWANAGFVKHHGISLEEFIIKRGKNLKEISSYKNINAKMDQLQKDKLPLIYNSKTEDRNGSLQWYQTTVSPVLDEKGNITRLIAIDSNITRLKEAETQIGIQKELIEKSRDELKRTNATKDIFFSIIGHDLKNPLHSIIGFSDLLLNPDDRIEEKTKLEFIRMIKESSISAYSLLENLLNWSRSQSEKVQFKPVPVDLNELVHENFQIFTASAESKNLRLIKPKKDYRVSADRNMLNAILRNLLSNAIKYTPKGGSVEISTSLIDDLVRIQIIDTGIGISKENQDKIFKLDSFYTSHGTEGEIGTGLGLIVCKDFIERHGSKIEIQSAPGKGSTFSFSLPLASSAFQYSQDPSDKS